MATIPTAQLSSLISQNPRTLKSYAFHLIPHMHYSHVMLVFSPPLHLPGLLKWRRHLILERWSAIKPSWKVYHKAHDQAITPQTIQAAWQKAGIHPLDYNEIPASAYLPAANTSINSTLSNLSLFHPLPTAPSAFHPLPQTTPSTGTSTQAYQNSLHGDSDTSSIIPQSSYVTTRAPSPSVADTVTTLEIPLPDNTPSSIASSEVSTGFSISYGIPIDTHAAWSVHPALSHSAILTQPSLQATWEELWQHIECLDNLVNRMACQIEADTAIKTIFLTHEQKLMEQLNCKLTHKKVGMQLQTSACHMTSEGGLQHAGFQSQKKHFKKVWPQFKKIAKAQTAAATKAAKVAREKEEVAVRPICEIELGRRTWGVRKTTAKQGVEWQVHRNRMMDSDVKSSSDGLFIPKAPPITCRKMHAQQAAQARTHTSMISIPRDSILESNAALMPMAPHLQIGLPPFTTDSVATPTGSQDISLHSSKPNVEIETQETHLYRPSSLVHEVPGIQCKLCPCPAAWVDWCGYETNHLHTEGNIEDQFCPTSW